MEATVASKPLMVFWSARRGPRTLQCVFAKVADGFVVNVLEDDTVVREGTARTISELHELHTTWRQQWAADGWSVI